MNREELTQQFGEEALDLFEGYLQFCQSARAYAEQLETNHGIEERKEGMSEEQETIEQRVRRLRTEYKVKEEQCEHSRFWSTEHIASHQTGTALQSPDPAQALQECVEKAQANLARKEQMLLDGLFHGNPEGWRSHYGTLIALLTTALKEVKHVG